MANKYRIYDLNNNVILDNTTMPINIPLEAGKTYPAGAFKWALLDVVGNELQKGTIGEFTASSLGDMQEQLIVATGTSSATITIP